MSLRPEIAGEQKTDRIRHALKTRSSPITVRPVRMIRRRPALLIGKFLRPNCRDSDNKLVVAGACGLERQHIFGHKTASLQIEAP